MAIAQDFRRRFGLISLLLVLGMAGTAHAAEECPDTSALEPARAVVRDLQRITTPNGIQEQYATPIGGLKQWLTIRGEDRANPVILFVHGGPASPVTPSLWQFQRPLEEYFTVVDWDQRGAGKTYAEASPDAIAPTLTIERYVDDAIEVAEHLRTHLGQRKVILMAHSWGTIVAMQAALKRPDLFHAYVGIGQIINQVENEKISFDYGLAQAKAHGNAKAVAELEAIAPYPGNTPITRERIITARTWPQYYGGLTAYRDDSKYYFGAARLSPDYTDADRCNIDKGSVLSLGPLLPQMLKVNFNPITRFPIPVVMFMGRHDYTTPTAPTERWLNTVQAPYKQGVWFEHSAHMVPWEEPGKTLLSLVQIVRPLARPD